MFSFLSTNLKKGIKKIKDNPQLFFTIFLALSIIGSFIYVANGFISIASDAQDRLVNTRIGAMQDVFVSFAKDRTYDAEYLKEKIDMIASFDKTLIDFKFIMKDGEGYKIIAEGGNLSSESEFAKELPSTVGLMYSLAAGQPTQSFTMEDLVGNFGAETRVFRTARAVADASGSVVGMILTTEKLSEADKKISDNIKSSILILVCLLIFILFLLVRHSRIIDYTTLYGKLREVDQLKDDFISMASHELRTPLTAIRGYSEFIREAPELTAETKDYASKIDLSAKALDGLVADILDVSRIEQGRLAFNYQALDPMPVLKDIEASLIIPAKDKGLALVFEDTAAGSTLKPQTIRVDAERFKQVFVNIIGNAVKYTKKGEVRISTVVEKGRFVIRVKDTGIGMSAEEQKNIFQKFYRVRNSDTADISGTGLGLWITKSIVEEMKGAISLESIKNVGTHFIVSFPIAA